MSKEQSGECEPKCGTNLILQWATKCRIKLMLQEPNYKHCVNQDDTCRPPHIPGERLKEHPC